MIYLLLPAFNEATQVGALLEGLRTALAGSGLECSVVLVDDGSTDGTAATAAHAADACALRLKVLQHAGNQGLAAALRTGLDQLLPGAQADDVVITMDADNTHPPEVMLPMAARIASGADIVVASRYRRGSRVIGVPFRRQILSHAASAAFQLLFPLRGARDYTCGYRAFRAGLLQRMRERHGEALISERGFSCMADLLLKARAFSPVLEEVPFVLRYDLKRGGSKMNVGRTVLDSLALLAKRRFGRMP